MGKLFRNLSFPTFCASSASVQYGLSHLICLFKKFKNETFWIQAIFKRTKVVQIYKYMQWKFIVKESNLTEKLNSKRLCLVRVTVIHWRRQASEFGGGRHLRGKLIFGGGEDRIFKKVLLFAHAVVTGLLSPPPMRFAPSQKGAIFLGIPPPGDEYPRNIAQRGEYPRNIAPL
jgi:hypothetical protein